ncbi:hypothetical protein DFQ27_001276 [Actinomortierella ambigua]|uniref:Ras-GAP domain-containing protein n=1 Tax=Actinomortierella ambigua TaxID=1343610 RepID=A0A9P6QBT1_9FUNG|nr:hypothetical protein DFQ27_001276 [Actinomortierella ambigua]
MITEPIHEFCDTIARIAKNQLAASAFETKKEMCKAIYALSATLNHAIVIKESFIIEKVQKYASLMFPPVQFPQDDFKDIQVANLRQTLIRPVIVDARDYVFEICSIDVYLMESVLQAATKVDFDEWKAALSAWIPPDEDIPAIEHLKISTPAPPPPPPPVPTTTKQGLFTSRSRHISLSRTSDAAPTSPRQRISNEFPVVKSGILYTDIPFETIPLFSIPRTHISQIDNSLFSKKHCFSIRTPHHVNYYTVSPTRSRHDQETLHGWIHALKSFAKPEVFGGGGGGGGGSGSTERHYHHYPLHYPHHPPPNGSNSSGRSQLDVDSSYRIFRTFSVRVNDGKLNKDVEAYCEITLDDERRARTSARSRHTKGIEPGTPFWRDYFIFSDLPPFRKGITINVIQVKGSKQLPIGQVDIPVHHRKEWDEGWYPINAHRTRSNQHEGDLRLKLRYEEQIVLPMEAYAPLLDMILNHQENNVISRLAELVTDLEGFAKNVLHILEAKGMATVWLNSLIDEEIAQASPKSVNTLFRANTLLTKALDAYMRLVGTEYLDDTLGDIIRGICTSKSVCEVDPSRLERGGGGGGGGGGGLGGGHDDLKANWRTLYNHTRVCWRAVTESVPYFPKELQVVFSHLQMRLTEKFKDPIPSDDDDREDLAALARYTGVSGFVFLRLICPAILGPKLFCIMREHPEARAHRTLTLIAKSLQGLANLVMFGNKESWMVPMNEFITENIQSLKDFIDRICTAEPRSPSRVDSGASSLRSVQIYPPQSPGSATSAVFRNMTSHHPKSSTACGSSNANNSSGQRSSSSMYQHSNQSTASSSHPYYPHPSHQYGPAPPSMVLTSTTSTMTSSSSAAAAAAAASAPASASASATAVTPSSSSSSPSSSSPSLRASPLPYLTAFVPERADELPILPYLIDLGKELASFATTVAHLPSLSDAEMAMMAARTTTTTTTVLMANRTATPSLSSRASSLVNGRSGGVEGRTSGLTALIGDGGGSSSSSARPSYDQPLQPPPPIPPRPTSHNFHGGSGEDHSVKEGFSGDDEEEDDDDSDDDEDGEEDIIQQVYRLCLHLMDEAEDRVGRAAIGMEEGDDDQRSLPGHHVQHHPHGHSHAGSSRGKLSREEARYDDNGGGGGGGRLMGYMTATTMGLQPNVHPYPSHPQGGLIHALQPPGTPSYHQYQHQQQPYHQYLMYEHYGGDGDAAAHLADNYYYHYGMEGYGSEDEGPI